MTKHVFVLLMVVKLAFSQVDMGNAMAAGRGGVATTFNYNYEALGINPANLGWKKNNTLSLGAMRYGISIQSEALSLGKLWKVLLKPSDEFSESEKETFKELFVTPNGLNLITHTHWISGSFQLDKIGGIAVELSDKKLAHIGLNNNFSDIVFNGSESYVFQDLALMSQNISDVFSETRVGYTHYRFLNISYGRELLSIESKDKKSLKLYAGLGLKRVWGLGLLEYNAVDGEFTMVSSFSDNYDINYGSLNQLGPSSLSGLFDATGKGYGLDFGLSLFVGNTIKVGMSIIDFGSITWDKMLYEGKDTTLQLPDSIVFTGINSFNLTSSSQQLFSENSVFVFTPSEYYKSKLPAKIRMGVGLNISKRIEVGADLIIPLNRKNVNLQKMYFATGAEINLFGTFKLSTGFGGNKTYGYSIPLGISMGVFGITEFQFGTNDLFTLLGRNQNPNLSMAFAALKFNLF